MPPRTGTGNPRGGRFESFGRNTRAGGGIFSGRRPGSGKQRLRAIEIDRNSGRRRRTAAGRQRDVPRGAEETMEPFNENLRGANVGDHKEFDVDYPADYPDEKLSGKKFHYSADVTGIKEKKLPELNDEFAKDVSDAATLDELRTKIRESLEHQRDHRQKDLQRERVITELVKLHDFPVPESLVEAQMDVRLERMVRSLAQQGVDPRAVNVDWSALRGRQQERAKEDVKAELIIDRIASAEKIDVTDEEVERELQHLASHSGESVEAIRARLTKQGALDRMKAKLRSDKTLDWLAQNANVRTAAAAAGS